MSILVWIVLAAALAWFVKYAIDHNIFHINKQGNKNRAFAALKKRYAKGEINKKEYESEKHNIYN